MKGDEGRITNNDFLQENKECRIANNNFLKEKTEGRITNKHFLQDTKEKPEKIFHINISSF